MQKQLDQVFKFVKKHNFPHGKDLNAESVHAVFFQLQEIKALMQKWCDNLEDSGMLKMLTNQGDHRLLRAHLCVEELCEVIDALMYSDELALLDGLSDLTYVVLGLAIVYNIPLAEGFEEVHRSNMTKAVRQKDDTRLRDKGEEYQPPNLEAVLERFRPKEE